MARDFQTIINALAGVVVSNFLRLPSGASGSPAAGDIYRVADSVRFRDSTNTERTLGASSSSNSQYFVGAVICPSRGILSTGSVMAANIIYFYPFVLPRSVSINNLGSRVTTAVASSKLQCAIYANNPTTGQPSGAPLGVTGDLDSGTAAVLSGIVSPSTFDLTGGTNYWMATWSNGAITLQHQINVNEIASIVGVASFALASSAASNSTGGWRTLAATFTSTVSPTPANWPTISATVDTTTVQTSAVKGGMVFMQIAALL